MKNNLKDCVGRDERIFWIQKSEKTLSFKKQWLLWGLTTVAMALVGVFYFIKLTS